jgi:hypothetical protein
MLAQAVEELFTMGRVLWESDGTPLGPSLFAAASKAYNSPVAQMALDWVDGGVPRLAVGHHHAASLICTRAAPDVLAGVDAPWPCFLVDIPKGLIPTPEGVPATDVPEWALVRVITGDLWGRVKANLGVESDVRTLVMALLIPASGPMFLTTGPIDNLYDPTFATTDTAGESPAMLRAHTAALRLIAGLLIDLHADPSLLPEPARRAKPTGYAVTRRGEPTLRTYQIAAPTGFHRTTDFRGAVREWVQGRRKSPVLQGVVAAHFRRVPCGEGGKDRKVTRVWTYWRGPEDAPIALRQRVVRAHRVAKGEPTP